jgi:aminocarboxymuconate-semialdehyde decarboxylase
LTSGLAQGQSGGRKCNNHLPAFVARQCRGEKSMEGSQPGEGMQPAATRSRGIGMTTIDFHAHLVDPVVIDQTAAHSVFTGFGARPRPSRPALDAMTRDPMVQLADMDRRHVDLSVLLHSNVHQPTSWAEPAAEQDMARRMNETVAQWVARAPDRYVGSLTLPLTDIDRAVAELRHGVRDMGMRVMQIPARVGEDYLGAPRFWPMWQAAQDHDMTVFIHPDGTRDPWFQRFSLWNSLGQSIEESKVMASLIYEGTLDRFPDAKIVMAHGGGYFPHMTGRVDRNVAKPEAMVNITQAPSTYLRRFHYDTCMYDPIALRNLIDRVGADRIVLGSDYPFGEFDPLVTVAALPNLGDAELALIAHGNAKRLLGLTAGR